MLEQGFVVGLLALAFLAIQQIERGAQVEAGFDVQILIADLHCMGALDFLVENLLSERDRG
ncbi:hypothetical protein D3C73_1648100 [compost metagenome]